MPAPERLDQSGQPPPYLVATRFEQEPAARRSFVDTREAIFSAPSELSTYRFLLDRTWYVTVVGEPPTAELDRRLRRILTAGQPAEIPSAILEFLLARRLDATR